MKQREQKSTSFTDDRNNASLSAAVRNGWMDMRFMSLSKACALGVVRGWRLPLENIRRVEALWEEIDGDSTAHGFVLELHNGSRVYVDYCCCHVRGDFVEHGETLPMGQERYPQFRGTVHRWSSDVEDLNKRLPAAILPF
jgi:hypothetical protein